MRLQIVVEVGESVLASRLDSQGQPEEELVSIPVGTYEVTGTLLGDYETDEDSGQKVMHLIELEGETFAIETAQFSDEDEVEG